mmetsp:Transcript_8516/g.14125  ORF Transcript_8516/g.14125 Transcript_8516/m.14125 type:complete len:217 (+) Transcript_8516:167-817(+)
MLRKASVRTKICMMSPLLVLLMLSRVNAFSEQLDAAEEEHLYDDRTLLDMFGEVAKEYFTKNVIPDTDEYCRWDWRHARCEPNCQCGLEFMWGDYHLGRSCRKRKEKEAPVRCDLPPDTPYAKVFDFSVQQSRVLGEQLKSQAVVVGAKAMQRFDTVRSGACAEIPLDCDLNGDNVYERSLRERIICGHIPRCDEIDPSEEEFEMRKQKVVDWAWT